MTSFVSDARRRAIDSYIYSLQSSLVAGIVQPGFLDSCRACFVPNHLQDVVEERSLEGLCGSPLCNNKALWVSAGKSRFRVSLKQQQIYETGDSSHFCSIECQKSMKAFSTSCSTISPYTRPELLEICSIGNSYSGPTGTNMRSNATSNDVPKRARRRDVQMVHTDIMRDKFEKLSVTEVRDIDEDKIEHTSKSNKSSIPVPVKKGSDSVVKRHVIERNQPALMPIPQPPGMQRSNAKGQATYEANLSFSVVPKDVDLNRDLTGASDLHGGDLNENDEMYDEKWECTALDADMEIWKQVLGEDMPIEILDEGLIGPWFDIHTLEDKESREEMRGSMGYFIQLWEALSDWVTIKTRSKIYDLGDEGKTRCAEYIDEDVEMGDVPLYMAPQNQPLRHMSTSTLSDRHNTVSSHILRGLHTYLLNPRLQYIDAWNKGGEVYFKTTLAEILETFDFSNAIPKFGSEHWSLMTLVLGRVLLNGKSHQTSVIQALEQTAINLGITKDEFRVLCSVLEYGN